MKVTGVPNCCAASVICTDEEFTKVRGEKTYYAAVEGTPPQEASAVLVSNIQTNGQGVYISPDKRDTIYAESIAKDLTTTEGSVSTLYGNYPTLMLAIISAVRPYESIAFKAAGWKPVLEFGKAHDDTSLILMAKPRKNAGGYGGKMKILSPENPLEVTPQVVDTGSEWKAAAMAAVPTDTWTPEKLTTWMKGKLEEVDKLTRRVDEEFDSAENWEAKYQQAAAQVKAMQAAENDRLAKLNEKRERKGLKLLKPRSVYRDEK